MTAENKITVHVLQLENATLLEGADVFDNPVDTEQLAAFVADSGHEMVFAMTGNKVVGMASGTVLLHPDKQPAFFVNEVGVNEDMRCLGIGTRLVQVLIELARDLGCKGIWLATESDNVEARALYRKLDARLTEAVVVYDWDGAMDD
jgi:ribosomal protein S18 acetylase RimI-like enzyme